MNLVPQAETAELSDTDLDQVSGGNVAIGAALIAADGQFGAGLHAESGHLAVTTGLGASAVHGDAHTTVA
ncbi:MULTISPECIES: hypothetical protein [Streptomyces]|uniref:Type A2 lantipeptide n=1 Tax=Streptomyces parvulus TaxID=146923 RepID=A0A369UUC5_9ACTN|nr:MULTISPECIES: hypothetical protein [Streptomyces]MZD53927.1 hypothetical protein [Streptomyces sp. SID5606]RDD84111.1 hypothetical protein DVZ84_37005 [Streptomyces parvulus]